MALFKILKGDSSRISTDTTPFHEGYAYFTPDDGGFYIDSTDDGVENRIRVTADLSDYLTSEETQEAISETAESTLSTVSGILEDYTTITAAEEMISEHNTDEEAHADIREDLEAAQEAITTLQHTISTYPFQTATLTYTGSALTPTWNGYNSTALTIGGTTSATDAGTYYATFTPNEEYYWSDGTQDTYTAEWTIERADLTVPSQSGTLTYTGSSQSPSWSNYDSSKMTISGTTSATDAGTYYATFTPTDNCQWSGGGASSVSVSWTIEKAAGSLSLSTTSLELDPTAWIGTITVTRSGDGTISATSSDTSVATASLSETTITVTAVASGTATITVSVAAGTNYKAPSSQTCSVTVELASSTLDENAPSVIQQIAQSGTASSYWSVGDMVGIELNGTVGAYTFDSETYYAYIIGFDHNSDIEGTNTIHFQMAMNSDGTNLAFADSYYSSGTTSSACFHMNSSATNSGGWESCYMRSTICPAFLSAMPSDWQSIISACTKYTDNIGGGGGNVSSYVTATSDEIWLLAAREIASSASYANSYEANYQEQYEYYSNGNSAIKYKHNSTSTACVWWPRSPFKSSDASFCYVSTSGSLGTGYNANFSRGFAPGFMVA